MWRRRSALLFLILGLASALFGQFCIGEVRSALEISGLLIGSSGFMALWFPRAPHQLAPLPLVLGAAGVMLLFVSVSIQRIDGIGYAVLLIVLAGWLHWASYRTVPERGAAP